MTTLASDVQRPFELGTINEVPVIAGDIIYEGAAVGDNGSGYARLYKTEIISTALQSKMLITRLVQPEM